MLLSELCQGLDCFLRVVETNVVRSNKKSPLADLIHWSAAVHSGLDFRDPFKRRFI